MASEKGKIVRVSYKQLENVSRRYHDGDKKETSSERSTGPERDRTRKSRKPEQAFYQPGKSRLSRTGDEGECHGSPSLSHRQISQTQSLRGGSRSPEHSIKQTDDVSKVKDGHGSCDTMSEPGEKEKKKSHRRRPDLQRYVPRPRLMSQDTDEDVNLHSEQVDTSSHNVESEENVPVSSPGTPKDFGPHERRMKRGHHNRPQDILGPHSMARNQSPKVTVTGNITDPKMTDTNNHREPKFTEISNNQSNIKLPSYEAPGGAGLQRKVDLKPDADIKVTLLTGSVNNTQLDTSVQEKPVPQSPIRSPKRYSAHKTNKGDRRQKGHNQGSNSSSKTDNTMQHFSGARTSQNTSPVSPGYPVLPESKLECTGSDFSPQTGDESHMDWGDEVEAEFERMNIEDKNVDSRKKPDEKGLQTGERKRNGRGGHKHREQRRQRHYSGNDSDSANKYGRDGPIQQSGSESSRKHGKQTSDNFKSESHPERERGGKRFSSRNRNSHSNGQQKENVSVSRHTPAALSSKEGSPIPRMEFLNSDLREQDTRHNHTAGHGKGRGIIKIPPGTGSHEGSPHRSDMMQRHGPPGVEKSNGRSVGHRTLYDPKCPKKNLPPQCPRKDLTDSYQDIPRDAFTVPDYSRHQSVPQYQPPVFNNIPPAPANPYFYFPQPGFYDHRTSDAPEAPSPHSAENSQQSRAILHQVVFLESQLSSMMAARIPSEEALEQMMELRRQVQTGYREVILLDTELANDNAVDQSMWKGAFYQVYENLRRQLEDSQIELKDTMEKLIEEGTFFFEDLILQLQNKYNFKIEDFIDSHHLPPENLRRQVKVSLYIVQRLMICLGDLARYKEQLHNTSSYGKARSWYLKAQQIAPKNGRPYNQLAILAWYTRRRLDAVYYYIRSLAASNPFKTARESLMALFDEARKKAEAAGQKKNDEKEKQQSEKHQHHHQHHHHHRGHRVELWVSPDGITAKDESDESNDDDLSKMSAVELNKRFVISFLNAQGKLFTKIGMETFPDVCSQLLSEFQTLLQHSPAPISSTRLLQIMAINMYTIDHTALKDIPEENCRSLLQENAIQLGLDMFGLMVERCNQLFVEHLDSSSCQVMSEDLHQLFPGLKVWSDWMCCHQGLWNPPPSTRDPALGPVIDVWKSLAALFNTLKRVDINHVKLYYQHKEGCDPVILPEDVNMAGFMPLMGFAQEPMFVHCTVDKEVARDCLRIEKVRTFGDFLCGVQKDPLLEYDVERHMYTSLAPEPDLDESLPERLEGAEQLLEEEDAVIKSDEDEEVSGDSSDIQELRERRATLQRRLEEQHQHNASMRAALQAGETASIQLEIRPQYLVPDTNCFIDHLRGLQKLLDTKKFTLVVPLVVIGELDGLSRGMKEVTGESSDHAEMVQASAAEAITFLEAQFSSSNPYLRAMTAKGTVMDTISFRSEETDAQGNNDDLILSCCLQYCQDKARDFMPKDKDAPVTLLREVVLLTDDRNLRLKAHTRNVPVKDIPSFLRWAKVP